MMHHIHGLGRKQEETAMKSLQCGGILLNCMKLHLIIKKNLNFKF